MGGTRIGVVWLAVSLTTGCAAWQQQNRTVKGAVYGSSFYIMSGFHGAHVIAGLLMLLVVLVRAYWGDFTASRFLFADAAVLYWHFVDVVWVFLWLVLYVWT